VARGAAERAGIVAATSELIKVVEFKKWLQSAHSDPTGSGSKPLRPLRDLDVGVYDVVGVKPHAETTKATRSHTLYLQVDGDIVPYHSTGSIDAGIASHAEALQPLLNAIGADHGVGAFYMDASATCTPIGKLTAAQEGGKAANGKQEADVSLCILDVEVSLTRREMRDRRSAELARMQAAPSLRSRPRRPSMSPTP
jgi:hypothetical protein